MFQHFFPFLSEFLPISIFLHKITEKLLNFPLWPICLCWSKDSPVLWEIFAERPLKINFKFQIFLFQLFFFRRKNYLVWESTKFISSFRLHCAICRRERKVFSIFHFIDSQYNSQFFFVCEVGNRIDMTQFQFILLMELCRHFTFSAISFAKNIWYRGV